MRRDPGFPAFILQQGTARVRNSDADEVFGQRPGSF